MSNHAHIIIRAEIQVLPSFMAAVLAEYAMYYNYKHQRNGHVFQNRFKSECIEDEKYFLNCLRYIHTNPVKAKIVKAAICYQHSSMGEYISETPIVLHPKAISLKKKYFKGTKAFEEYHGQCEEQRYSKH